MEREEFYSLLHRVYRRGLMHGGLVAVGTALLWFSL